MEATAQLNTRLNPRVKAAGESSIQAMGLSVTEFTRKLWDKLAQGGEDAESIRRAVLEDEARVQSAPTDSAPAVAAVTIGDSCAAKLDALSHARRLRDDWMTTWGYGQDDLLGSMEDLETSGDSHHDDRQLAFDAMLSRMHERGTL